MVDAMRPQWGDIIGAVALVVIFAALYLLGWSLQWAVPMGGP